jgi:hypothetical protein
VLTTIISGCYGYGVTKPILRKYQGFLGMPSPFLTHNMARPPKDFLARGFRVNHEKKSCGATLSVRAICFSIGTTLGAIGLFLPHNMAPERGQHQEGKKGKKGHATLCGRTFCIIALY